MSIADEEACKAWRTCDDVLNYDSEGMDMITRLHLAMYSRDPKGMVLFSTGLFDYIVGHRSNGMYVRISVMLLYGLHIDIEHSVWIALELMKDKTTHRHGDCTGDLIVRIDNFSFSKKIIFTYKNQANVKRDLVAHFYQEDETFVFIIAFAYEM